jgi:hypothetical protein
MWRQGDVLIAATDAIPPEATRSQKRVLAYGEVTGHSHRVEEPEKAEVWECGGERFLKLIAATRIIHEEHRPITLGPGIYRVWQQREYSPQAIRRIWD